MFHSYVNLKIKYESKIDSWNQKLFIFSMHNISFNIYLLSLSSIYLYLYEIQERQHSHSDRYLYSFTGSKYILNRKCSIIR